MNFREVSADRLNNVRDEASTRVATAIGMKPERRTHFHEVEVEIYSIGRDACRPARDSERR